MNTDTDHSHEARQHRNPVLSALNTFDWVLGWLERIIVGGSVLVMAGLMSLHVVTSLLSNVIAEYGNYTGLTWLNYLDPVIPSGIPGTYEVTEMLIIVMTFVGVGYAARNARHISMSAVYDQLSGRVRKALLIVICLGTGALMFFFAYKSAQYVIVLQERGRVSSSLHVPMWIVNTALPVGFTLAGMQYLLTIIRNLINEDIWRSFNEKEEYSDVPVDDDGRRQGSNVQTGI